MTTSVPDVEVYRSYRQKLFDAGLLLPSGVEGVYGRSRAFERVVGGLERLVGAIGVDLGAEMVRFPPVVSRSDFLRTDYLHSFPDMAGDVSAFSGDDQGHQEVLGRLKENRPWSDLLEPTEVVLCPAVCHPLYPTLGKEIGAGGEFYDVCGYVFRHEPSFDPARLMSFRQYEIVYVGTPDGARLHRDRSLERALEVITDLGVEANSTLANDPFFGRAGRMLKANQRADELKYEVLAPTSPAEKLTAVASANWHADHFGREFGLHTPDGADAHTACVGYGLERITLSLVWAHGTDVERWPKRVRDRLWP